MNISIVKKWYVVQVISGSENKVIKSIHNNIKQHNLYNYFGNIIIPKEEIIEIKFGNKRKSERKFFPGYILIEMEINNYTLILINNTINVIGFLGKNNPINLNNNEVELILKKIKNSNDKPTPKVVFNLGEHVRINHGPFSDFNGIVENIDYSKNRLTVSVSIFGRSTPVVLNFNQIEKVN